MKPFDFSRVLFYLVCGVSALGLTFAFGLYSGARQNVVYKTIYALKTVIEEAVWITSEEASTLTKIHPKHFLHPVRYKGEGVTVNEITDDGSLIMLSGFFQDTNEVRLIRRNGAVVARWPVSFTRIFPDPIHLKPPPETDWNIDLHGALVLPDGSVVFNFEYGGLVKLDRCGNTVWTLAQPTHHSVERSEAGGFWVPGRRFWSKESESPFPPFKTPFREDTVIKVSDDGEALAEFSVVDLFYKNELEALLTSTGHPFRVEMTWDKEILHLNKIEELTSDISDDFPLFKAGDLALSMAKYNLMMVVDPDSRKIKWWRMGPWLRQHDPEFKRGGKLVVFNNNVYRTAYGTDKSFRSNARAPRVSNIMEIDMNTNEHKIIYGGRQNQAMLSIIRGKLELTPRGGLLVTEFDAGRAFETDPAGRVIWEYINRYSSEKVAGVTEARVYPTGYFTVTDWTCE